MQDSTTYQYVLDQGRIETLHKVLLAQGRERFGAPDESTIAAITAIKDIDRLQRMGVRLVRVAGWQELLRTR